MSADAPFIAQIRLYQDWLREARGLAFDSYDALWRWSVTDLDAFWQSMSDYAGVQSPTPHTAVLADARMPGATWFPGAQVNYTRELLRHADAAHARPACWRSSATTSSAKCARSRGPS
jgi:acetoacetyl-CoA synthetase